MALRDNTDTAELPSQNHKRYSPARLTITRLFFSHIVPFSPHFDVLTVTCHVTVYKDLDLAMQA